MAEAERQIEPEDRTTQLSDTDSSLGDDAVSSTASVTSSVLSYQYENGRRYHAFRSGTYVLPNDEAEQDRLDLTHHIQTLLLEGELYRSPLSDPKWILDVGTGTGKVLPFSPHVSLNGRYPVFDVAPADGLNS